jgi:hypothetical protein
MLIARIYLCDIDDLYVLSKIADISKAAMSAPSARSPPGTSNAVQHACFCAMALCSRR